MDKCGRLESVAGRFVCQADGSELAEFVVDKREEVGPGLRGSPASMAAKIWVTSGIRRAYPRREPRQLISANRLGARS